MSFSSVRYEMSSDIRQTYAMSLKLLFSMSNSIAYAIIAISVYTQQSLPTCDLKKQNPLYFHNSLTINYFSFVIQFVAVDIAHRLLQQYFFPSCFINQEKAFW